MDKLALTCEYVMQNASRGVAECDTALDVDLFPLKILIGAPLSLLLFIIAGKAYVWLLSDSDGRK